MRLTKKQREQLFVWVAEGLQTDEINRRAAEFDPPFEVSRQQVDHYRKSKRVSIKELVKAGEDEALKTGLALRSERVKLLKELAALLTKDVLGNNLWVTDVRLGKGVRVEVEKFNDSEVNQLRGVLDDIAREMGERRAAGSISVSDAETVIIYVPDNGRNQNR